MEGQRKREREKKYINLNEKGAYRDFIISSCI